jgi:hypothetical protein
MVAALAAQNLLVCTTWAVNRHTHSQVLWCPPVCTTLVQRAHRGASYGCRSDWPLGKTTVARTYIRAAEMWWSKTIQRSVLREPRPGCRRARSAWVSLLLHRAQNGPKNHRTAPSALNHGSRIAATLAPVDAAWPCRAAMRRGHLNVFEREGCLDSRNRPIDMIPGWQFVIPDIRISTTTGNATSRSPEGSSLSRQPVLGRN